MKKIILYLLLIVFLFTTSSAFGYDVNPSLYKEEAYSSPKKGDPWDDLKKRVEQDNDAESGEEGDLKSDPKSQGGRSIWDFIKSILPKQLKAKKHEAKKDPHIKKHNKSHKWR